MNTPNTVVSNSNGNGSGSFKYSPGKGMNGKTNGMPSFNISKDLPVLPSQKGGIKNGGRKLNI